MTTLITLSIPLGGDAGPFNLYSNTDGYTVPFATGISAAALTAGYTSTVVPEGTTIIRVVSTGWCTNYIDITINLIPTTTTTSSTSTSSTTTTTTTVAPTTTTTSSSTSTTTSTTTEFVPFLNNGTSGFQANPATEGCDALDYPFNLGVNMLTPSIIATRVLSPSVTWSDIEYLEIVSVTDDPNMTITYDGSVVAPAMQFLPATSTTWQYSLDTVIDAFSCINALEVWEIRVKLTGYPISNIAIANIAFYTNPYCPDCTITTTTTTTTPDIAPGVALYWHAVVGTYTNMNFQVNRRRGGIITYNIAGAEQQYGQSTTQYYNGLNSISNVYPDNLQAGDEIQITAYSEQQIPGGGGTVELTIDLQRTLRNVANYSIVETQTATGSFATTQIPVTIGSWYAIDPSMYLYEVNSVSQLV